MPITKLPDSVRLEINRMLKQIQVEKNNTDLAKRAGYAVDTLEERINELEQNLLQIKATYFPNKP